MDSLTGILVNRLTISKLHINGILFSDRISLVKLKESLTLYGLVARGLIMSDKYLGNLCV